MANLNSDTLTISPPSTVAPLTAPVGNYNFDLTTLLTKTEFQNLALPIGQMAKLKYKQDCLDDIIFALIQAKSDKAANTLTLMLSRGLDPNRELNLEHPYSLREQNNYLSQLCVEFKSADFLLALIQTPGFDIDNPPHATPFLLSTQIPQNAPPKVNFTHLLAESGANVNVWDEAGTTAAHFLLRRPQREHYLQLLIEHGLLSSTLQQPDKWGTTAFSACLYQEEETTENRSRNPSLFDKLKVTRTILDKFSTPDDLLIYQKIINQDLELMTDSNGEIGGLQLIKSYLDSTIEKHALESGLQVIDTFNNDENKNQSQSQNQDKNKAPQLHTAHKSVLKI